MDAQTIWILLEDWEYEGYAVIGVYLSQDRAREAGEQESKRRFAPKLFIQEWSISTTKDGRTACVSEHYL